MVDSDDPEDVAGRLAELFNRYKKSHPDQAPALLRKIHRIIDSDGPEDSDAERLVELFDRYKESHPEKAPGLLKKIQAS